MHGRLATVMAITGVLLVYVRVRQAAGRRDG